MKVGDIVRLNPPSFRRPKRLGIVVTLSRYKWVTVRWLDDDQQENIQSCYLAIISESS